MKEISRAHIDKAYIPAIMNDESFCFIHDTPPPAGWVVITAGDETDTVCAECHAWMVEGKRGGGFYVHVNGREARERLAARSAEFKALAEQEKKLRKLNKESLK